MNNKINTLIFDLDGTLIHTEPTNLQSLKKIFNQISIEFDDEDLNFLTGRTRSETLEFLKNKYQFTQSVEDLLKEIRHDYRTELQKELPIIPFSAYAVKKLAIAYNLPLVSGSSREEIKWALKKLDILNCFDLIVGCEDYKEGKPSPEGYLLAMKKLNVGAENVLIFEDSLIGVQAARASGARVVVITHSTENKSFQPDIIKLANYKIRDFQNVSADWVQELTLSQ